MSLKRKINVRRSRAFLWGIVVFSLMAAAYIAQMLEGCRSEGGGDSLSLISILRFFFDGSSPYVPTPGIPFAPPWGWLSVQAVFALIVSNRVSDQIARLKGLTLLARGSRMRWWIAECRWVFCASIVYYLSAVLVALVAYLIVPVFIANKDAPQLMCSITQLSFLTADEVCVIISVPIMSFALGLCQVALSIAVNPIVAFLSNVAYCVASSYCGTPPFFADRTMLLRTSIGNNPAAWQGADVVALCSGIVIVAFFIGLLAIDNKDIL